LQPTRISCYDIQKNIRIDEGQSVVAPKQCHDLIGRHAWPSAANNSIEPMRSRLLPSRLAQHDLTLAVHYEFNRAAGANAQSIADSFGDGNLAFDGDGAHDSTRW
jgi:hypothetical protein